MTARVTKLRKDTKTKLDTMFNAGANPEKMKTTDGIGIRYYRRWIQLVDNSGKKQPLEFIGRRRLKKVSPQEAFCSGWLRERVTSRLLNYGMEPGK